MAKQSTYEYLISIRGAGTETLAAIRSEMRKLQSDMENTKVGTARFEELSNQLQDTEQRFKAIRDHARGYSNESSSLSSFIRAQSREQREQNFLFRQGKDVIGAASIGLALFANTAGKASDPLKKLSASLNDGYVTFQGLSFALAGTGPWGQVAAGIGGVVAAIFSFIRANKESTESVKEQKSALDSLLGAYTEWENKLKGNANQNRAASEREAQLLRARLSLVRQVVEAQRKGEKEFSLIIDDTKVSLAESIAIEAEGLILTKKTLKENEEALRNLSIQLRAVETSAVSVEVVADKFIELKAGAYTAWKNVAVPGVVSITLATLEDRLKQLNEELKKTPTNSPQFSDLKEQIIALERQIKSLTGQKYLIEIDTKINAPKPSDVPKLEVLDPEEIRRQQSEDAVREFWSGYKRAAVNAMDGSLQALLGFGAKREEIDVNALKRHDRLAQIGDTKDRQMLAAALTNKEISQEEYNLRIEDLEAASVERRKEIEAAYAQNQRGVLDDLKDVWNSFWDDVAATALHYLAQIAANKVFQWVGGEAMGGAGGGMSLGSAAGTGIGMALGGPVGGLLGGFIGGLFHEGGTVPKAHQGMFIDAPSSREFPIIVRGGETVRTEAQEASVQRGLAGGGGGNTFIFNFNSPVSDVEFVRRGIIQALRDTGLTVDRAFTNVRSGAVLAA